MNYFLISTVTLLVLGAIAVVLTLTLEGRRSSSGSSLQITEGPDAVRVRKYSTSISVHSRLLTGQITVEFVNKMDCAASGSLTLQLPVGARVTDLVTEASDECQMLGVVQSVFDAQESFHAQSSAGKSAAILQAWDLQNYPLWASVPPSGTTKVYIVYEELLSRKNYQIPFHVPIGPGVHVDELTLDIKVSEPSSGVSMFDVEEHVVDPNGDEWRRYGQRMEVNWLGSDAVQASLRLQNVAGPDFPRMVRAWYDYNPSRIQDDGILSASQSCLSYLFNPSSTLYPIPKAIVFVVDVSGSMRGEKLDDAKAAFRSMIDTLSENEIFSIQAFSKDSSKKTWGPSVATSYAKQEGIAFVDGFEAAGGTNLNGALIDAFLTLKGVQDTPAVDNRRVVSTIVFLSDGRATSGVTDRPTILRNVRSANLDMKTKIFSLGFGKNADMPLLTAISIQHRGRALPIHTGYGDSALQLQDFYDGELRDVFLSDVRVSIEVSSNFQIESQTQSTYPIFAGGSEITIRARPPRGMYINGDVLVTTTAITSDGPRQWSQYTRIGSPSVATNPFDRECTQSFAHAKISEVLAFAEAMESLGAELYDYVEQTVGYGIGISVNRASEMEIISSIKGYAFDLAMEAGLVWPGLTAMVTMENDNCKTVENEVCSDEELWRAGLGRQNPHGGVPDSLAGDEDDAGPMSNPFTTSNAIAVALLSSLCILYMLFALLMLC